MYVADIILEYLRVTIWPLTVMVVVLIFRRQVVALFDRIRYAQLPGGIALDLAEARSLAQRVQEQPNRPGDNTNRPLIPLTEANARMIALGLQPSPSGLDMTYYRQLAEQDPNVALAGLLIEIDVLARNLARGFDISVAGRASGSQLLRRLYDTNAITHEQMLLALKVLEICNTAVHGCLIARDVAVDVIASAEVLADQYLAWLSWGFKDGWTPKDRT